MKKAIRDMCMILTVGLVALSAHTASAQAGIIAVGNHSFETVGTDNNNGWYSLPTDGDWVGTGLYSIKTPSGNHFSATAVPDGDNVLNLGATSLISQDLGHTVNVGDTVSMTFAIGNNKAVSDGGDVTTSFTIDGTQLFTEVVDNDAADDQFLYKTVQWTAGAGQAGNLVIRLNGGGNGWIDDVSVTVTYPTPAFSGLTASPTITYGTASVALSGTLSATGPAYPEVGDTVTATIGGNAVNGTVTDGVGSFSITYNDASLAALSVAGSPHTITYAYAGNGSTLSAAADDTTTSLTVTQAASITVTADAETKVFGDVTTYGAGGTAFSVSDLQGSDTIVSVTLTDTESGGPAGAAIGTYLLTPSAAVFGVGDANNYASIIYDTGILTVAPPLRLLVEAEVQVDTSGPIGTAKAPAGYTVDYGVNASLLNGALFQISGSGELTFIALPNNDIGDVYYVEVTAAENGNPGNNDAILVEVTVVPDPVPSGTVFKFR